MADNELQTAIPAGEQSNASGVESQPSNQVSSESGAEQTSAAGQQPGAVTEQDGTNGQPDQQPKKTTPWYQHRINELTLKRKEEAERAAKLETELAKRDAELLSYRSQGQQPQNSQQTQQPNQPPADVDQLVKQQVEQRLKQQSFDDQCNKVFKAGVSEYPDFADELKSFGSLGGLSKEFLEAAVSLDGGHKVLHHLAQNLELAYEFKNLTPVQLGSRMSQLSAELNKPKTKPVSSAPAPTTPIDSGANRGEIDLSNCSMEEYVRAMNAKHPIRR